MLAELFLMLESYGYFGAFLINLIASSTIVLPLPGAAFVFGLGAVLNPLLVGIAAGVGAAIGEFTGYALGWGGRKIISDRWKKQMRQTEKLFQRYGGFFVIMLFAMTPLPDDIAGIVAGVFRYPVKKYFIAVLIGKLILNITIAYAGMYGTSWVLNYLF
jgi:membrane protein DedA with SNARE-associated domain